MATQYRVLFAEALANEGDGFDRGRAFARARELLRVQGYDAMWIDTGEGAILAVFNPDVLTIRDRLSADEVESLVERLEESGIDLSDNLKAKDFAPAYSDFLDEIGRGPRVAKWILQEQSADEEPRRRSRLKP
jgi:hypothetical protein